MRSRVKIHVDIDKVKPIEATKPCITICDMDGNVLRLCRKVALTGCWILRQYNNPVPCGATVVLFTEDETSNYEVIK